MFVLSKYLPLMTSSLHFFKSDARLGVGRAGSSYKYLIPLALELLPLDEKKISRP